MKTSYYPGCSLEVTAKAFDLSTRQVCRVLDVELEEVPDWQCCGSSAALKKNRRLSLALASQNLAQAERQSLETLVAPCPFCHRRLLSAQQELKSDKQTRESIRTIIETTVEGELSIQNILEFVSRTVGISAVKAKTLKPLKGIKVIPYYGCYTVKPFNVTRFDDPENPVTMDEILAALGAEILDWDFKTECCGASLSLCDTVKVLELSGRLIKEALWRGADVIAVACQLCHSNLDMRQADIRKIHNLQQPLPILYITQLMGLAFGLAPGVLGIHHHLTDPLPLLREKGLAK